MNQQKQDQTLKVSDFKSRKEWLEAVGQLGFSDRQAMENSIRQAVANGDIPEPVYAHLPKWALAVAFT